MTEDEYILYRLLTSMKYSDVQIYRMDRWIDADIHDDSFIVWERKLNNPLPTKLYSGKNLLTALDVLIEGE